MRHEKTNDTLALHQANLGKEKGAKNLLAYATGTESLQVSKTAPPKPLAADWCSGETFALATSTCAASEAVECDGGLVVGSVCAESTNAGTHGFLQDECGPNTFTSIFHTIWKSGSIKASVDG